MAKSLAQDADAQSSRRLAKGSHVIAGASRNRPCVPAVVAGDHGKQACHILDAGAYRAAVIDGITDRHRTGGGDEPPGRFEAVDTAPTRGRADRSALVSPKRHRHFTSG